MEANGFTPSPSAKTLIKTKPRVDSRRVLVTGGSGFVGSHLCDFLIKRGDYVGASGGHSMAEEQGIITNHSLRPTCSDLSM